MATRVASSGVMSTLARPATPTRPNSDRDPRLSQTIEELMTAPCSTVLNGYTFTPAGEDRVLPDEALVAEHHALLAAHAAAEVAGAADGGAPQPHALAEVGVVVHDDPLEVGVGSHPDVGAEHRVGPEPHARLDAAVLADDGRAHERSHRGGPRRPPPRGRRRPSRSRGSRRATRPSRMSLWAER